MKDIELKKVFNLLINMYVLFAIAEWVLSYMTQRPFEISRVLYLAFFAHCFGFILTLLVKPEDNKN